MKILIAGDFCPQNRVNDLLDNDEYESVLGEVKHYTSDSDYSIVNLECPVTNGNESPITKFGPNLGCSEKGIDAQKWVGFDCVTYANNHFLDYGPEGVENTLSVCQKCQLQTVGGGRNLKAASETLYKEINGKILAIINCCEHEFSIASEKTAGSNPLNPILQYHAILEAKSKADYVLLIVHGGHEHFQLPSPRMQELYRFFVEVGADAVVNHHQHCISGFEIFNGKPIFYGLGNFCFDGNRSRKEIWHEGYMVQLSFSDMIEYKVIPYIQCKDKPKVEFLADNNFDTKLNELNSIIKDQKMLRNLVDNYYASCADDYSNIFEPSNNRYYLGAKARGWLPSFISKQRKLKALNFILCEAHRDKLIYWLKNN